ncbi:MAG: FISUMP domain-containing protein [Prolixibacteraceae bacterium]|jgi:uncharacterized protein (TIGR02145 family)|nr:FISUMP domain-containing protein [Prolixibacteraceae bacterium]
MRKLFTILAAILSTASVFAQSPEKMSYQAVIRNSSDVLVTNQQVGMQISILQGSASGTAIYVETQTPTTNANGLVSIEIGAGTVVSGDFATIDWANDNYFIKTETDPAGGTSYSITGTSQLLSVPYALHAKTAESVSGGVTETDPVYTAWDKSTGISITESQISDLQSYLTTEVDGSVTNEIELPTSGTAGDMAYWNGSAWVTVAATENEGATLQMIGGVPTWTGGTPPNVTNPTTGKIWMDRNLGASQVATSRTDAAAYGDLYQWGRAADGHQIRTSGTTATLATSDTPGHGNFIINRSSPYDWRNPRNDNLWQGVSGTNNPCPSGYRLPTEAEWEAERTSWSSNNAAGAFASPLKLPLAGNRYSDGDILNVGSYGRYWSSTVGGAYAGRLEVSRSFAGTFSTGSRADGFSVRCLKD